MSRRVHEYFSLPQNHQFLVWLLLRRTEWLQFSQIKYLLQVLVLASDEREDAAHRGDRTQQLWK
jgi:hypothetical protein